MGVLTEWDRTLLDAAIGAARDSLEQGGIPIGAALGTPAGELVATGHNLRVQSGDTTAHAETVCMRNAGRRRDWHTMTMATTLSPCVMCCGAALLHRIPRLVIGEHETYMGDEELLRSRGVELVVEGDPVCVEMMRAFIEARPELWNEDIGLPEE